jgi:hypothetical protein
VNSDDVLSPPEIETYARAVLADLAITVDGQGVQRSLVRVDTPAADAFSDGQGTIRIEASVHAPASHGSHRLVIRNQHLPGFSVYLANALLPDAAGVAIVRQTRDLRQQTFWLDYEIRGRDANALAWLLAASSLLSVLVCGRMRSIVARNTRPVPLV